jgi:hypothetical protein
MNSGAKLDNWTERNLHNISMILGAWLACICELEVTQAIWIHPTRVYDLVQIVFMPLYVLFPILFAAAGQLQIRRLVARGGMSDLAARPLKSTLGTC